MSEVVEGSLDDRFRALIRDRTGIQLPPSKRNMIEARLRRRIVSLGLSGLDAYLAHLFDGGALDDELPAIIDAMTTNKTDFFREKAHFDLLLDRLVPAAVAAAPRGRPVPFKVWSAAASIGAEAWTTAMVLAEAARRHGGLEWGVLGTDISPAVLSVARRAVYPAEDAAPVPPPLRDRYLMTGAGDDGQPAVRVVPELRRRVRFARLNLIEPPYPVDRDIDVIFLRNVLIYFSPETQARVIAALAEHLRPGGHLIVGHSESMTVRQPGLRQVAAAVYQMQAEDSQ